ncbi:MAG: LysR substrate-binding domain-containing protein [Pseudomonadota bacterium]
MHSLDLDLLRTFVAIADTGNFSAAAAQVYRTPSAVSMQVKKMEEALDRPLFLRDSRSVRLTDEGERVLTHARRMIALDLEFRAQFDPKALRGEVRLGVPDDVAERYLPDMLRRFCCTYPGVQVNAMVGNTAPMMTLVAERKLDIAIITRLPSQRADRPAEVLRSERLVWAGARGGIAHEQDPIPVSVWDRSCAWRKAGIEGLEAQGRDYRIALESGHLSGQKAAVLADLAVAPIPISALGGDVVEVPLAAGLPDLSTYELCILTRADLPEHAAAAADHLRASFASQEPMAA